MADKDPTMVKFIHKFTDDYRIIPANGAWGGVSPRGDLLMHFFIEHAKVPQEEIQVAKEDGSLSPPKKKIKEIEIVRTMQIGVNINIEQATHLANWILENVERYKTGKMAKKKEK